MPVRYPILIEAWLHPAEGGVPIVVESPDWFTWLQAHPAFTYQEGELHFAVRCEQLAEGRYWYAYKRVHRQLFKCYLGRSQDLTLGRLREAARRVRQRLADGAASSPSLSPAPAQAARAVRPVSSTQPVLLETRFLVPALPLHHIPRPRLQALLEQQTQARLTLVCAPAGAGKTTLLAEWARATTRRVLWLSLEEEDNDPLRFLAYVRGAFAPLLPAAGRLLLAPPPLSPGSSWAEVLTPFLNELTPSLTDETVLVLDDAHLVTAPEIYAAIGFLVEHAPPTFHLVLGTRTEPPLPLTRLRARGQLGELRWQTVRFTSWEAERFLQEMQLQLAPEERQKLVEQAGGWIVSLQLLALALREQASLPAWLNEQPGSHPFFLEYVSEELLRGLPEEERRFLLYTSVLERLTGPLCEEVTQLPAGQQCLLACYRNNLLITPTDATGTWYRYHPLFAQALRTLLQRQEPAMISTLYQRASRWHEEYGDRGEACHYALLAGDWRRAAVLLEELLLSLIAQGRFARLARWLEQLPAEALTGSPPLMFAALWKQAIESRSPQAATTRLQTQFARIQEQPESLEQGRPPSWEDLQSQLMLWRVVTMFSLDDLQDSQRLPEVMRHLQEELRALSTSQTPFSRFTVFLLQMMLYAVYRLHGDLEAAEQVLLAVSQAPAPEEVSPLNLLAYWGLAELYEAHGRLRIWGARLDELWLRLGPHPDLPPLPLAVLLLSQALLFYEWNRLPEADALVQEALPLAEQIDFLPVVTFCRWLQARIRLAQGLPQDLAPLLDHPEHFFRQIPHRGLTAHYARLALACGRLEVAWHWMRWRGLRFDDALTLRSSFFEYMTLARILIAAGRARRDQVLLSQALQLLEGWRTFVLA
ncbi:MAG: hypothetical protein IMW90_20075, partial [Thermogemmatispora sp.]|uniref:hypothetical protein n=1 Tax=Thermogemmatispora sp. TaxID=1968838 RepID=UPI0019DA1601